MRWRRRLLRRQRKAAAKRGLRMDRAFKILRTIYGAPLINVVTKSEPIDWFGIGRE